MPVLRRDREEAIADTPNGTVRSAQDPVLQNQRLTVADTLQRIRRGVEILRVDARELSRDVRHVVRGHAPDLCEGRAEVIKPPALQIGQPEDIRRMLGKALLDPEKELLSHVTIARALMVPCAEPVVEMSVMQLRAPRTRAGPHSCLSLMRAEELNRNRDRSAEPLRAGC